MVLTDEELIGFALDGEVLSEEARYHLEQCKICQRLFASYKQTNAYLVSRLYRSQCPTGEQISFYCADLLSEDECVSIANHVLDCPLCSVEVAETRKFLQMQDIELPEPFLSPRGLVYRIFATQVAHPQPNFALRDDIFKPAWPRLYKAESVNISLHLTHISSGQHMLLGILTSTNPVESVEIFDEVAVELYTAPFPQVSNDGSSVAVPLLWAQVDDLDNFVFKPVPPGEYVLVIYLPNREIVLEGLTIE